MIAPRWAGRTLLATTLVVAPAGPFDIPLFGTPRVPGATGTARLVFAASPFGVAVTADGRARYDVQIDASGLPDPSTLGGYSSYVAWAVTTDLSSWTRLGTVTNGRSTVGHDRAQQVSARDHRRSERVADRARGPTVLHGTSPSGWLQSFLSSSAVSRNTAVMRCALRVVRGAIAVRLVPMVVGGAADADEAGEAGPMRRTWPRWTCRCRHVDGACRFRCRRECR